MNNQARRRIEVGQEHILYQSNRHLENHDPMAFDNFDHFYDANTPIATVRCFWQHIVSSTVGANLVNIQITSNEYEDDEDTDDTDDIVEDRHSDGTPVTIGYLAGLGTRNINNDPDFSIFLFFVYVMDNVVDEPHCICNL